jgi:hypothetical protein
MVIHLVGVEIELSEFIDELVKPFVLVEFLYQRIEREVLNYVKYVFRVTLNVVVEIYQDVGRVALDSSKIELGCIEERKPNLAKDYRSGISELVFVLGVQLINLILLRFKDTVQPPHHDKGKNHSSIFGWFKQPPKNVICTRPNHG